MLFVSFDFLLFFIPVLLLSWALTDAPRTRVWLLIGASYFFYMAGPKTEPLPAPWYFVYLLVFSTQLDFVCSRQIHKDAPLAASDDPQTAAAARRRRNFWLLVSLVGNLGLLGYFKYTNFFLQAFADTAAALGLSVVVPHLDLILPVGISFYTFQSLSYTIDVWRGRLTPEPSFRKFALFVVFFPQLVAGPIERAPHFLPQLRRGAVFHAATVTFGLQLLLWGLFKKVVVADNLANLVDATYGLDPAVLTASDVVLGTWAFSSGLRS